MTFQEAYKACTNNWVVWYDAKPHVIEYTTAGGSVRPIEGIARIRLLNETTQKEVSVHEILLDNPNKETT